MKMRITREAMQILKTIKIACTSFDATCQDQDGDVCIFWDAATGCILKDMPEKWRIYDNISET